MTGRSCELGLHKNVSLIRLPKDGRGPSIFVKGVPHSLSQMYFEGSFDI